MIEYRNKHFMTWTEFVAEGGTIPAVLSNWDIGAGTAVGVTFGDMFADRFADRVLQYPIELGILNIQSTLNHEATRVKTFYQSIINAKRSMLDDVVAARESETIEAKLAPNGGDGGNIFESAYSNGGTIRKIQHGATVDALEKVQNDLTDTVNKVLSEFDPLFMPRRGYCYDD